jgi:hypothetical protein
MESLRRDGIGCLGVAEVDQQFLALVLMQDLEGFGSLEVPLWLFAPVGHL